MVSELAESYDPLGAHMADPYPFYARARSSEPVFYSPRLDAWVITRFDDVDAILKDPAGFSSVNTLRSYRDLYPATLAALSAGYPQTPDHITSDGGAHRRLRQPYAKHLTEPGRLKAIEPEIRARAEALVEAFAHTGGADLVAGYSSPLPVRTAAALFGFAEHDVEAAREGSECLFSLGGTDCTPEQEAYAGRTAVDFQRLLADYARARRSNPTGDLISDVVAALAPGGEALTYDQEAELVTTLSNTFGAAHITTTDTIGNALRLLAAHPEQWKALREEPSLMARAVEEALRFEAPIPALFRRALNPSVIGGVEVPQNADLLLVFASANRDEERFGGADRFDVTRAPGRHFGFGAGVHTCVGAALARTQARIALRVLVERLPGLRLDPEAVVPVRRSLNVRGPLELPLRW